MRKHRAKHDRNIKGTKQTSNGLKRIKTKIKRNIPRESDRNSENETSNNFTKHNEAYNLLIY